MASQQRKAVKAKAPAKKQAAKKAEAPRARTPKAAPVAPGMSVAPVSAPAVAPAVAVEGAPEMKFPVLAHVLKSDGSIPVTLTDQAHLDRLVAAHGAGSVQVQP